MNSFQYNLCHDPVLPIFGWGSNTMALVEGSPLHDKSAPDLQIISCMGIVFKILLILLCKYFFLPGTPHSHVNVGAVRSLDSFRSTL